YLDKHHINESGNLKKSIKHLLKPILDGVRLEFGSNMTYAVYVHEGTRPHWPPTNQAAKPHNPIRHWVIKKLNPPADRIDSVTWFVRKKIAEQGTPAKPFLAVAWRALKYQIPMRLHNAIEHATGRL